ncbi:branched-chain amino acid ABC transporter permease [Pseudogemmobacter faecipullorum]|uniref:Branched-chain amino acid ABC transporter permease n=1 Tax=Pseudogemmobacter faecipullorum TaxID=2755041 RepID=A0ABS8CLK4_9RHOB|nr:branched-chain amino acid ABC transporter permease [Pseudogemmobacter faecipullorum]MCB5410068.1 branched-chain amino acid ABC transporter permease [Pseudogemmobacter faecipullorum]
MSATTRNLSLFAGVGLLFILTGMFQSWNLSLNILNLALLSAIMAIGVNIQWGWAGLFSAGIVGSVALGGLAVVLVSGKPVPGAWEAGTPAIWSALAFGILAIALTIRMSRKLPQGAPRSLGSILFLLICFFIYRALLDPAVAAVEANNSAQAGHIGGLGLNSLWAWPVGALFAAAGAWVIGKVALGLREDYLAIATLGIGEIIIAVLRNEDWLARGVKNLIDLPRPWPVPYEVALQADPGFIARVSAAGLDPVSTSAIMVKLIYAALFCAVLLVLIWFCERALNSPWGRMTRAIRDNEIAAAAMGKNVKFRHLQIFIIGSAVVGLAGAMMTSLEGQLTPPSYTPLRFTFLIWVMVIVGGSGNNWGAILGGVLIGWLYLAVEFLGPQLMGWITAGLPNGALKTQLAESAAHMRLLSLGVILLLVLRFAPRGLIPEK